MIFFEITTAVYMCLTVFGMLYSGVKLQEPEYIDELIKDSKIKNKKPQIILQLFIQLTTYFPLLYIVLCILENLLIKPLLNKTNVSSKNRIIISYVYAFVVNTYILYDYFLIGYWKQFFINTFIK